MKKNNFIFCIIFLSASLMGCMNKADKIDFILPNQFSGNCVIIFNCKDGTISPIKNGRKTIIVPQSGIVKLQEGIKYGQIDYRYFMLNKSEQQIQLKEYQSFQTPKLDSFYVGTGTTITHYLFNNIDKKTDSLSAFIFFVHKLGNKLPSNYSDKWIADTLESQIKINKNK